MIAFLSGKIKDVFDNFVIINSKEGVGYKIEGLPIEAKIIDQEVEIYVYTHYTQQETRLFGFLDRDCYMLFHSLIGVSGVGPKSAIVLLNNIGVDNIKLAVLEKNHKALLGNGIGQKIAQKIVIELEGKFDRKDIKFENASNVGTNTIDDVKMALEGLGYNQKEISNALATIDQEVVTDDFNQVFRATLNLLKKKTH